MVHFYGMPMLTQTLILCQCCTNSIEPALVATMVCQWCAATTPRLWRPTDVLLLSYCSSSHLAFLCHCSVSLWYAIAVCQCCMPMLSYYGMPLLKPNTPPMPMLYPVLGVASKQVNDRFSASADPNCVLSSIYIDTSHCCDVLFCTSLYPMS